MKFYITVHVFWHIINGQLHENVNIWEDEDRANLYVQDLVKYEHLYLSLYEVSI